MFTPVQPDRLACGERSADGCGADRVFAQVHADAGNRINAFVLPVYAFAGVHHHALGIGNQCEKRGACNRASQTFKFRSGGLDKFVVLVQGAVDLRLRQRVKAHFKLRLQALLQAALPALADPVRHPGCGQRAFTQHVMAGLFDLVQAVGAQAGRVHVARNVLYRADNRLTAPIAIPRF